MSQEQVSGIAVVQALACHIAEAYENSALFFLGAQLRLLLEEHQRDNGLPTSVEMEELIAKAAQVMIGKSPTLPFPSGTELTVTSPNSVTLETLQVQLTDY
jgi:hypothetical protein